MLKNEARWIGRQLCSLDPSEISPLINLGCGPRKLREEAQPFIQEYIFAPLEERGVEVVHTDMEYADGVDVVGDFFEDSVRNKLTDLNPKCVICANILEHVVDNKNFSKRVLSLIEEKGYIVVTVPSSFPYHPAPIDTLFRPNLNELHSLFEGTELINSKNVKSETFGGQLLTSSRAITRQLYYMVVPLPFSKMRSAYSKLRWLFVRYKTSCLVLRK